MPYKDPEAAKARSRRYYQENRDRIKSRSKDRHESHKDEINLARRTKRQIDPEIHREEVRRWRQDHPETKRAIDRAYYMSHRETIIDRVCQWQQDNPERVARRSARRRAQKRASFVEDVIPLVVLELDDGVCGICKEDVDPFDFHVDHVIPLAKGGWHSYSNVQVAHPICNLRKGVSVL
jgi:5-methylcytosine-specific restriction endonuclease McrA